MQAWDTRRPFVSLVVVVVAAAAAAAAAAAVVVVVVVVVVVIVAAAVVVPYVDFSCRFTLLTFTGMLMQTAVTRHV